MVMIWSRVLGDKSLLCMIDCASQCGLSVLCMYDCASAHFGSLSLNSMHGARHWWNFYSTALAWDLELVLSGPQLFPFSEEVNTAALRSAWGGGGGGRGRMGRELLPKCSCQTGVASGSIPSDQKTWSFERNERSLEK